METIPLHEILSITEMKEDPEFAVRSLAQSKLVKGASRNFTSDQSNTVIETMMNWTGGRENVLQLKTVPEGFNFGRIYYFNAGLERSGPVIVEKLSEAVRAARIRFERKSRYEKSQEAVRSVQESTVFQTLVAGLIMLVSGATHFEKKKISSEEHHTVPCLKPVISCAPRLTGRGLAPRRTSPSTPPRRR